MGGEGVLDQSRTCVTSLFVEDTSFTWSEDPREQTCAVLDHVIGPGALTKALGRNLDRMAKIAHEDRVHRRTHVRVHGDAQRKLRFRRRDGIPVGPDALHMTNNRAACYRQESD